MKSFKYILTIFILLVIFFSSNTYICYAISDSEIFKVENELESEGEIDRRNITYKGAVKGAGLHLLGPYYGLTYYSQADSRWAKLPYTSIGDKNQTMKSSGCGPTVAAMLVSSSKGSILPPTMANIFVDNGYRTAANRNSVECVSFYI